MKILAVFGVVLALAFPALAQAPKAPQTLDDLKARVNCSDFKRNPDGTYTSGAGAKLGTQAFAGKTFGPRSTMVDGADLYDAVNGKCLPHSG